MRRMKMAAMLMIYVFTLGASSLRAQAKPKTSLEACRRFVQSFYNWYLDRDLKELKGKNQITPWGMAIKYRGNSFSDELVRALAEADAETKAERDPVLDFDPILNTQDPADRYVVKRVTHNKNTYNAEVFGVWSQPIADQGKKPQVIVELAFEAGQWHFVNFHYPDSTNPENENLLSIVKYRYPAK